MDFDGYAIGGVSVGEPEVEMYKAAEATVPHLPEHKVRYAMGLGQPHQMVELVARGVDIFDCVLPTRVARHATGLHPHRHAEFARRAVPDGPRAARFGLRLLCLSKLYARLYSPSIQSG